MTYIIIIGLIVFGMWLAGKILPIILRCLLYSLLAIPLWIVFGKYVPGVYDECALALIIFVLAIARSWSREKVTREHEAEEPKTYVVNTKSNVIHSLWSPSAADISEEHREYITESEMLSLKRFKWFKLKK